ncbi:MAG: deaminase [Candidatus Anstonellales archaeon]
MIIGLTGENCAGKGTVAEYLTKRSFYYYSLSDAIREDLAKNGMSITRENLIKRGNELRDKYGPGILAERIMQKIELNPDKNFVVDSFRNPAEVEVFRKRKDFVLVYVTASQRVRFERMRKRGREGDPNTFDAFLKIEEEEAKNEEKTKQNTHATYQMADKKIENELDFKNLYMLIDGLLATLSKDFVPDRPSWDEYFMSIAKIVASRSNCIKRKVAAVIVKDKRIISTGYNGTPRGCINCNEGGCNSFEESGKNLSECVCAHAEENAISQAAYHGISVARSTIYVTYSPCLMCARMIINSGIREVVYNADYPMTNETSELFKQAGVLMRQYKLD